MEKDKILNGNILIAEYIGGVIKSFQNKKHVSFQDKIVSANSLRYHKSWNRLMPIWIKITEEAKEQEGDCNKNDYLLPRCEISKKSVFVDISVWNKKWHNKIILHSCYDYTEGKESDDLLECYWKTIIDIITFIKKVRKSN